MGKSKKRWNNANRTYQASDGFNRFPSNNDGDCRAPQAAFAQVADRYQRQTNLGIAPSGVLDFSNRQPAFISDCLSRQVQRAWRHDSAHSRVLTCSRGRGYYRQRHLPAARYNAFLANQNRFCMQNDPLLSTRGKFKTNFRGQNMRRFANVTVVPFSGSSFVSCASSSPQSTVNIEEEKKQRAMNDKASLIKSLLNRAKNSGSHSKTVDFPCNTASLHDCDRTILFSSCADLARHMTDTPQLTDLQFSSHDWQQMGSGSLATTSCADALLSDHVDDDIQEIQVGPLTPCELIDINDSSDDCSLNDTEQSPVLNSLSASHSCSLHESKNLPQTGRVTDNDTAVVCSTDRDKNLNISSSVSPPVADPFSHLVASGEHNEQICERLPNVSETLAIKTGLFVSATLQSGSEDVPNRALSENTITSAFIPIASLSFGSSYFSVNAPVSHRTVHSLSPVKFITNSIFTSAKSCSSAVRVSFSQSHTTTDAFVSVRPSSRMHPSLCITSFPALSSSLNCDSYRRLTTVSANSSRVVPSVVDSFGLSLGSTTPNSQCSLPTCVSAPVYIGASEITSVSCLSNGTASPVDKTYFNVFNDSSLSADGLNTIIPAFGGKRHCQTLVQSSTLADHSNVGDSIYIDGQLEKETQQSEADVNCCDSFVDQSELHRSDERLRKRTTLDSDSVGGKKCVSTMIETSSDNHVMIPVLESVHFPAILAENPGSAHDDAESSDKDHDDIFNWDQLLSRFRRHLDEVEKVFSATLLLTKASSDDMVTRSNQLLLSQLEHQLRQQYRLINEQLCALSTQASRLSHMADHLASLRLASLNQSSACCDTNATELTTLLSNLIKSSFSPVAVTNCRSHTAQQTLTTTIATSSVFFSESGAQSAAFIGSEEDNCRSMSTAALSPSDEVRHGVVLGGATSVSLSTSVDHHIPVSQVNLDVLPVFTESLAPTGKPALRVLGELELSSLAGRLSYLGQLETELLPTVAEASALLWQRPSKAHTFNADATVTSAHCSRSTPSSLSVITSISTNSTSPSFATSDCFGPTEAVAFTAPFVVSNTRTSLLPKAGASLNKHREHDMTGVVASTGAYSFDQPISVSVKLEAEELSH